MTADVQGLGDSKDDLEDGVGMPNKRVLSCWWHIRNEERQDQGSRRYHSEVHGLMAGNLGLLYNDKNGRLQQGRVLVMVLVAA